ncbi:amino acid ABC transporter substrate-binding protein [Azorhizobium oxalatiphilum]|uniref:Amino acid ABC transporter substrate-binding protein n=1 Tax=Azorhizobium oxalatiphilum TaxID=980631 RepID=A0A917F4T0_9HYPH|nr:transporter substrate-binding domain-containing protein [Azorhizobium oxalatiphilum]GGF50337.1 amino acid ABC transporter substrate-binding protein [Azorhizobium oxalatiphilum]
MRAFRSLFLSALLAAGLAAPAHADALDDVKASGKLRVALTLDYPPFGVVRPDMSPDGYDVELAHLVAKKLGVKAELVPVTSPNKIPYMQTKKADLLFNIGRTDERAKVVDFSAPYAPYFIGLFGPANIAVKSLDDMKGKSVATTKSSFEEQILSKNAPEGTQIKRYDDNAGTIAAFISGQTDLIALGNVVAASVAAQKPARMPEQKILLINSPVRSAVLKGETRLLAEVDAAIAELKADGTLQKMSEHWLKQPLPADF